MLKSSVLSAIAAAKVAVQDLVFPAVHVQRGAAVHVPGSTPTYPETLTDISVFFAKYKITEIDGDRIQASDWQGISFPEAGQPIIKANDIIRIPVTIESVAAGDYRVVNNEPVMVGSAPALYQMQLRPV